MRFRSQTWGLLSLMLFLASALLWRMGNERAAANRTRPALPETNNHRQPLPPNARSYPPSPAPRSPDPATATTGVSKKSYRVTNTSKSAPVLAGTDTAVLLRNAFLDTADGRRVSLPKDFQAQRDPGSYIVQSKGVEARRFRATLESAGAAIISYIPNHAYLVELSPSGAAVLQRSPEVQAVIANEPYYKVEPDLLAHALEQRALPPDAGLKVTFLESGLAAGKIALEQRGLEIMGSDRDPFGPQLVVRAGFQDVAMIARLGSVLAVERVRRRELANDLTRERLGIVTDTLNPTNYLGLTGTNVVVNINDTGVDASHPDLVGRVFAGTNFPAILTDLDGHGTHVAGTIASSGKNSPTNAANGSVSGATFRGMAPAARLFVLPVDLGTGPYLSDAYLQETTASNRVFISNNSWGYFDTSYNSSSASYDAAVRDSLPRVSGSHPLLYVFSAGNEGFGDDTGQGGEAGSIRSPANAKNVIAVGAIESLRELTNNVAANGQTNQAFLVSTDSRDQVASFSSRGNVGISIEGEFGRFKPDVLAPGSFIVSTRSSSWRDPAAFTNFQANRFTFQVVHPAALNNYSIFVPDNASELTVRVLPNTRSPSPFPVLPIYLRKAGFPTRAAFDFVSRNNQVTLRVPALTPGEWFYSVGNETTQPINHDIQTSLVLTNDAGDYFVQLKQLNDRLAPHYRYESGSSMAAPAVSGLLALMQEFFEQRLGRTNSPALMKALLINGARSLGNPYDLRSDTFLNQQGWGVANLSNSIPFWLEPRLGRGGGAGNPSGMGITFGSANEDPLQFLDQTPDRALASGQEHNYALSIRDLAQEVPLRVTLVWTDPPGNPNAAIKLVNDLDLVVSNIVTHETFSGNRVGGSSEFTSPTQAQEPPFRDFVNNVETVFLNPPIDSNYVIRVTGRRVNVNAVTAHPRDVVQDYALVVSAGDLTLTNGLRLAVLGPSSQARPITIITNGVPILGQHVGANPPLLGSSNGLARQWNFYVFTNAPGVTNPSGLTNGTNVAFVTFFPPNLSRPRNIEADIDLYVSSNPALTTLDTAVLAAAFKGTNRGGTETVVFTNASLGDVFYVGVKSEDQQAAEYGFAGFSSNIPFDEDDGQGNRILHGFPLNVEIPDGSADRPGGALVFAIGVQPLEIQRVIVTNVITHESLGDLLGDLTHNNKSVVLNNHRLPVLPGFELFPFIYDDSNQSGAAPPGPFLPGAYILSKTDGPGSLTDFVGEQSSGLWLLTMVDNSLGGTGRVNRLDIHIDPNPTALVGRAGTVLPGQFTYYYVDVPTDATNLTVSLSAMTGPLDLYVRRGDPPTQNIFDKFALLDPPGGSLMLSTRDIPPLRPGRYYIGVFNPNAVAVNFRITVVVGRGLSADLTREFSSIDTPMALRDDAITSSSIEIRSDRTISEVKVGVRIDHPRVSDLSLHLVSPIGTRILLSENRGGLVARGYGSGGTNGISFAGFSDDSTLAIAPIKFAQPPFSTSTTIRQVQISGFEGITPGTFATGQNVDGWRVLTNDVQVIGGNAHTGTNALGLNLGRITRSMPTLVGQPYTLTFAYRSERPETVNAQVILDGVLNRFITGSNSWQIYTLAFTAKGNDTTLELSPALNRPGMLFDSFELTDPRSFVYYLPEESLNTIRGESAEGRWQLEVWDNRVGPAGGAAPVLLRWELQLDLTLPNAICIPLFHGKPVSDSVNADDIKFFCVDVPRTASFATNRLTGSGDLVLLFNQDGLPSGNNPGDITIDNAGAGGQEIYTAMPPALVPGQRYYLGVKNFRGGETNTFTIRVDFDRVDGITTLTNGRPYSTNILATNLFDYYQYFVSSNATSLRIALFPTNGDLSLYVREQPLPDPTLFDYRSANQGTNAEVIRIDLNSAPPLQPGWWYIGVENNATNRVNYSIVVTESTNTFSSVIDLTNGVPISGTLGPLRGPSPGLQSVASPNVPPAMSQVFKISVPTNAPSALFELYNLTGNADLLVGWKEIPDLDFYHKRSVLPDIYPDKVIVRTNTSFPTLAGDWYLAVVNRSSNTVDFTVRATIAPTNPVVSLRNGAVFTNTVPGNISEHPPEIDYYQLTVSSNALFADFAVTPLNGNVELVLRQGRLPVVTLSATNSDFSSRNGGGTNEYIRVRTNSTPVRLTAGEWFIGVYNAEPPSSEGAVGYAIQATGFTNAIVDLISGVPVRRTIGPGTEFDYYRFPVSPRVTGAFFQLLDRDGDVTFYLAYRLPLPDPTDFDYTPSLTTEPRELFITTNSAPVPLQSGDWYLTVQNRDLGPVTYTIEAEEFFNNEGPPQTSTNTVDIISAYITNGFFCLVWASEIGTSYRVEGKTNLNATTWDPISTNITATSTTTTYCIPSTDPHRFFRVIQTGSSSGTNTNSLPGLSLSINAVTNGYLLSWRASASQQFEVQYATNLPPAWAAFTNRVSSTNGNFSFLDDGSRTGGFGPRRFYRLSLLP